MGLAEDVFIPGISLQSDVAEALGERNSGFVAINNKKWQPGLPEFPGDRLADATEAANDGVVFYGIHVFELSVIGHCFLKFLFGDDLY